MMINLSEVEPDEIRAAYVDILPHPADRNLMCAQLLRSIGYCESTGSEAWSVSLLDSGFRLNVGQVEVLTCFYTPWDHGESGPPTGMGILDFRFLISGQDAPLLIQQIDPASVSEMHYRSVGKPHWAVTATLIVNGEAAENERIQTLAFMEALQAFHKNFVIAAAHSPTGSLRKRSNFARFHCEALISYARHELASDSLPIGLGVLP